MIFHFIDLTTGKFVIVAFLSIHNANVARSIRRLNSDSKSINIAYYGLADAYFGILFANFTIGVYAYKIVPTQLFRSMPIVSAHDYHFFR